MILTLLFACPVAAETWTTPEAGVRVPLPEGWVETGSGSGRRSLTRADDPHEDFRDSIILLFRPRTARADPQQLLEMLTADAARQQAVEVKRSELIERAGHRVAWFDAMLNKGPNRILAQQFLLPRDDGIVVVFGFSAPARAAEVRGLLEAMLDGLELVERNVPDEDKVFVSHAGALIPRSLNGHPLSNTRLAKVHVLFSYAADPRDPLLLVDVQSLPLAQGPLADLLSRVEHVQRIAPNEQTFAGLPARAAELQIPNGKRVFVLGLVRGRLLWLLRAAQAQALDQAQAVWKQLEARLTFVAPSDPSLQLELQSPLSTVGGLSLRLPAPFRLKLRKEKTLFFRVFDFREQNAQLTLVVQDLGQVGEPAAVAKQMAKQVAKDSTLEWTRSEGGRNTVQISATYKQPSGSTVELGLLTNPSGRSYSLQQLIDSDDPAVIERYRTTLRALLETASVE
ncbi:MAG: hypothetical protein KDD82_12915 [Planctomycetes bacterium]|nr:hypothetical protein [Planctomycetota bacterium]